ncbi:hypothetical protein Psed_4381 [Pseudonocardia dioxanivorans CB1190]|uniref:DUF2637 domain-containing protein n=1 Tax=Pseudonocardia dioxanivorans (strain ATCC 55486 / DSM 44775 / JCM 13855 / CB1190) TaxID=675635 RepID=F4CXG5_PSEUX|nr:hypothetical protein [Pseudonocardia dioxanivorans]AEA26539.1 hypothetical protein Psed_4381 [Pseudonocardia dioxanivorans CB1190]
MTDNRGSRWVLWLPGLIVALGAAAATAHGLYEVAVAARVPTSIAWIYPLITDGLAVVAYTATARLEGSARGYAWSVVVLSAGLSGLAQAVFLASDVNPSAVAGLAVPSALRFGIGAWPAIAAALAAHLLHLLAADHPTDNGGRSTGERSAVHADAHRSDSSVQSVQSEAFSRSERSTGRSIERSEPLTAPLPIVADAPSTAESFNGADGVVTPFVGRTGRLERGPARGPEAPARDRALAAAARLAARSGELPTVSEVEAEAGVSRGTAATALKTLREDQQAAHARPAAAPDATGTPLPDSHEDTQP